jgi:hypothetical protein
VGALLLLSFQNCENHPKFNSEEKILASNGNGDSYGGKPDINYYLDPVNSCAEKDRKGNPLPNSQIYVYRNSGSVFMVRENCVDIKPRQLQSTEYSFANDGTLAVLVNGLRFDPYVVQNELDLIAASCPAGMSERSVARTNLVPNSQDMTDVSTWWNHIGILASFNGVIGALPSFSIERNDPTLLDYWRRAHYAMVLKTNTRYAFSFLLKPGTDNSAFVSITDDANPGSAALSLTVDSISGVATVTENKNFLAVSSSARSFSGARFVTVYFTTPASIGNSVIGLGPNGTQLGDAITTSSMQLEEISSFCQ